MSAPVGADEGWDSHWHAYGDAAEGSPANTYRTRLILDALGAVAAGDRIVDLGCGQGELALELARRFPAAEVRGLEYSAEGVARAKSAAAAAGLDVEFAQQDLLTDGPPVRHVEQARLAVCSEVLEHVDEPTVLVRNARRFLEPGARVVITVPGGPRSAFDRHIGHREHFTEPRLRAVLRDAGLDVEAIWLAGFPFFNLYRLAVIARGKALVRDIERGHQAQAAGLALKIFDRAFRHNRRNSRFGWQLVAIAREPGERR